MEGKNKKTKVFKWAAVLMLAAMMIGGCKQAQGNSSREEKYEVTVSAGSNGTVTVTPELPADKKVAKGQELTITATASTGYEVDKWTISGSSFESGSGAAGSITAKVKVTANTTVNVTFKPVGGTPSTPSSGNFATITPPAAGITGIYPDPASLPGTDNYWKGVFCAGRKVKLSPYKLGKTEVTYKLWKEVYDWAIGNGYTFANVGQKGSSGSGSEEEPVTCVSWQDCIVWCNAYTQKIKGEAECVYRKSATDTTVLKNANDTTVCYADMRKKGYRLPTEAEWEYAARWQGSGNTNAEQYGEVWLTKLNSTSGAKGNWKDEAKTKEVAWYGEDWGTGSTHPIGKKRANALGLHDMSGNVREWCFDGYDNDPRANDAAYTSGGFVVDPQVDASDRKRVQRGGGWYESAKDCVVGRRTGGNPSDIGNFLGFRVACRP